MTSARILLPACLLFWLVSAADGQIVQFPVVGVSTVQTTVSVPDRGSAFLGGVSRGAAASNRFGFSPFGSSVGRMHSRASQRAFVTIHDFEEAGRILLSAPRHDSGDRPKFRNARAKSAWNQLMSRR